MWNKIGTCPYGKRVVLGCWHDNYWLFQTVGNKKNDKFVDERFREITTATHWHELADKPEE